MFPLSTPACSRLRIFARSIPALALCFTVAAAAPHGAEAAAKKKKRRAPETTLVSGPSGTIAADKATFVFTSSAPGTFQCRLDSASWSACAAPKSYSALANGPHTFRVRAIDRYRSIDATPASRSFTVAVPAADTTPPDTTIAAAPSGTIADNSPSISFSSEAGASFSCQMDSGSWQGCSSAKSYSSLADGQHTFAVRATDAAGNTDPTPASASFTVSTAPATPPPASDSSCSDWKWDSNGYGTFSPTNAPGACWRPFASTSSPSNPLSSDPTESPFNAWATGANTASGSASTVSWLTDYQGVAHGAMPLLADDPLNDGVTPIYWENASSTDPVYRLKCTSHPCNGGLDAAGTVTAKMPTNAQPQGVWPHNPNYDNDAHLTIVDQSSNTEYELFHVVSIDNSSHVVTFDSGGVVSLSKRGVYSDADQSYPGAVASETAVIAGIIRPEELDAGEINHALAMQVPCVVGDPVYPAVHTGASCADYGIDPAGAPAMGQHFRLDLSAAEQTSLKASLPAWKWTIVEALMHYGAFVTDTTGTPGNWGFQWENSKSYSSLGQTNQWDKFVADQGAANAGCYSSVNDISKCYYHRTPQGAAQFPNDVCDGGTGELYHGPGHVVDMHSGGCYGAWWMQLSDNAGGVTIPWDHMTLVNTPAPNAS